MHMDFYARHSLGQNFLVDRNILEFIVERSAKTCAAKNNSEVAQSSLRTDTGEVILEVGPGQGVLTRALLDADSGHRVKCLHAVEFDERLHPVLEPIAERDPRLVLHWGDVMKFDLSTLDPFPTKAIANIPYNITTPLIWKLLPLAPLGLQYYFFMVQSEAADRLTAAPDTKARYPLGVALEVMGRVTRVRSVPATCFRPVPRVESALIEIDLHDHNNHGKLTRPELDLAGRDFTLWKDLLHRGFTQRRKTLINNLKGFLDLPQSTWEQILTNALTISKLKVRAEDLTGDEWLTLLRCVKEALACSA